MKKRWRALVSAAVVCMGLTLGAHADTISSITSNFNGTAVPSGSYLWFSAVGKLSGSVPSTPFTLYLTNSQITFTSKDASHSSIVVNTPNAAIPFGPSGTIAFNTVTDTWDITAAYNASGNVLLDAGAYLIPAGIAIKRGQSGDLDGGFQVLLQSIFTPKNNSPQRHRVR